MAGSIDPITVDFETEAINGSPVVVPPRPVGVAVLWSGPTDPEAEYITQGMRARLLPIWEGDRPLLFHNAPFDLSVAREHLDLPWPAWERVHDTQYLVFLNDPYGPMSLKEAATAVLGVVPEARNDLREWVLTNVEKATPKSWGAYISEAPEELVAPYAIDDVRLTRQLFDALEGEWV